MAFFLQWDTKEYTWGEITVFQHIIRGAQLIEFVIAITIMDATIM